MENAALENTIREIPRIPISGAETGVFSGLGTHLYVNKDDFDMTKTVFLWRLVQLCLLSICCL